jgi:hypothetical protein
MLPELQRQETRFGDYALTNARQSRTETLSEQSKQSKSSIRTQESLRMHACGAAT